MPNKETAAHYIAPGIVGAFNPLTDDPNIFAWYELETDTVDFDKDGSNGITDVYDKTGNGHHLEQTTAARRPLHQPAQLNGLGTLTFDSSNTEYLLSTEAASTWNFLKDGSDFMIIRVCQHTIANPATSMAFAATNNGSTENGFTWFGGSGTGEESHKYRFGNGTSLCIQAVTSNITTQIFHTETIAYQRGLVGNDMTYNSDRILVGSGDEVAVPTETDGIYTLNVGRRGGGTLYSNHELAALIFTKNNGSLRSGYEQWALERYAV